MKSLLRTVAVFGLALVGLATAVVAKSEPAASAWSETAIVIDGLAADWGQMVMATEKDVAVDYSFRNDAANLYILFSFKNPQYLSSLESTGLTVWLNGEGKKKKIVGVRFFSKPVAAEDYIALVEKKGKALSDAQKQEIRAAKVIPLMTYELLEGAKTMSLACEAGVRKIGGSLNYELCIPLAILADKAPAADKPLAVGFEWGGMTDEMRRNMARPGSAGGGSHQLGEGIDTDPEGRTAGAGMMGRPISRPKGPKKYDFWAEVALAKK